MLLATLGGSVVADIGLHSGLVHVRRIAVSSSAGSASSWNAVKLVCISLTNG